MYDIRPSTVDEMLAHAGPLFDANFAELERHKGVAHVAPDAARYHALEQAGAMFILCAFHEDTMVGYSINFVMPHPHYSGMVTSLNDLLFVHPAHRAKVGLRLISATERWARERGAALQLWCANPNTKLDSVLAARGCAVQEIIYSKGLH